MSLFLVKMPILSLFRESAAKGKKNYFSTTIAEKEWKSLTIFSEIKAYLQNQIAKNQIKKIHTSETVREKRAAFASFQKNSCLFSVPI